MPDRLPILYSFRRCPYAMRARLALSISQQARVHREVDLKDRPDELRAASAKATVPVLVLPDERVIDESFEIMLWALANRDPEHWLPSTDAQEAETRALISRCDGDFKHNLDRYKYASRHADAQPDVHREQASEFLRDLNRRLEGSSFLFGNKAGLADMALAPFVRQFALTDRAWFDAQDWTHLRDWLDAFLASEFFAGIMTKHEVWRAGAAPVVLAS